LNISRKNDYIGSVDIDMVRISYIFYPSISVHNMRANFDSKERIVRTKRKDMDLLLDT